MNNKKPGDSRDRRDYDDIEYLDEITKERREEREKKGIEEYEDLREPLADTIEDYESASVLTRLRAALANDVIAGMILIVAAILALILANSPIRDFYATISNYELGYANDWLHLKMSVSHWAQDGILAIFFFTVGLELKEEFVTGSLRDPKTAALPIIAAAFGMAGPATVYLIVTALTGDTAWHGWAIPTATDIAFAVAILQIFGRGLPLAARTFLLTLAVADDLGGILVIAFFYSSGIDLVKLLLCFVFVAIFALLLRKRIIKWWLLIPIAIVAWYFMHDSGVHATISGVLLGMVTPAVPNEDEEYALTHVFTEKVSPISAGFAVPVFAFFAAGVNIIDTPGGAGAMLTHPITLSVALALPLGKLIGIFGSVVIFTKFTPLRLGEGVEYGDVFPISLTAGIGFTVALLISHLAFVGNEEWTAAGSLGVVVGTFISVVLAAIALTLRVKKLKKEDRLEL